MTDLVEHRILPPDYRIEVHLDEYGRLCTNRIGLSPDVQLKISEKSWGWRDVRDWTEKCGQEMIQLLSERYDIPTYDFIVMSDQQQMHTLEIWIITRRSLERLGKHELLAQINHRCHSSVMTQIGTTSQENQQKLKAPICPPKNKNPSTASLVESTSAPHKASAPLRDRRPRRHPRTQP